MLARVVWLLVVAIVAAALAATLGFVVATLPVRVPYWGEAEVLFEASRLREHLALFVDPLVGAREHGLPPERYYVTYPPVWTWVVSLVPGGAATVAARLASSAAWFGTLAWLGLGAPRGTRREAGLAAAFVGGVWVLANFATTGRPDSFACAIAAIALARAVRMGRLDLPCLVLFVLVPWVKPTVIGLPAGAVVGATLADRRTGLRTLAGAALLAAGSAIVAHVASGGALFTHVVRSNAQPLTLAAWLDHVPSRLPWFAPLLAWAGFVGWRDRARPGARIGLAALAGASAWTLFALAKTGSSSNYWMEPAIAAVVLIARTPASIAWRLEHAVVALVTVIWAGVASVSAAIEHGARMRADAAFVASVRARLGLERDDVVAADEAGIELALDGRILTPTYQMVHLVRAGRYPTGPWIEDLGSPRTRAFVEHTGQLRLAPALQRALEERYVVAFEEAGFRVWKRR